VVESGISHIDSPGPLTSQDAHAWWTGNFVHGYYWWVGISTKRLFGIETMQPVNEAHLCIRPNVCTVVRNAARIARGVEETDESC
jgi:hypothetical protein